MIALRDKSLQVAYIQIFLKEYFPDAKVYNDDNTVTTLNTKELKVTGIYDYITYQVLACYMYSTFPNEKYPNELVIEEGVVTGVQEFSGTKSLTQVITENLQYAKLYPQVFDVPDRVLSYILNEVVTPLSSSDEVFRIQKMMYAPGKIPNDIAGVYNDIFKNNIEELQQQFIDSYTFKDEDDNDVIDLPPNYKGFKVTGYCDPWTEVLYEN